MTKIDMDYLFCKGCGICIAECPRKVFERSKERNSSGMALPEAVRENDCVACRRCEIMCPEQVINIIEVENK